MIKITSSKVKRSGIELTKGLFVNCTSNAIAHLVVAIYNDDGYKLSSPYAKLVLEDIRDEVLGKGYGIRRVSISESFDRCKRQHYWVVRNIKTQRTANFYPWIYGAARAEKMANDFYQTINNGGNWQSTYKSIPLK